MANMYPTPPSPKPGRRTCWIDKAVWALGGQVGYFSEWTLVEVDEAKNKVKLSKSKGNNPKFKLNPSWMEMPPTDTFALGLKQAMQAKKQEQANFTAYKKKVADALNVDAVKMDLRQRVRDLEDLLTLVSGVLDGDNPLQLGLRELIKSRLNEKTP